MGIEHLRKGRLSMNKFIFDVDGTLTPSRGLIDEQLKLYLLDIARRNDIYFATGSDKAKTVEQLGEDLFNVAKKVYNCSGNDVYTKDENIYTSSWTLSEKLEQLLTKCLEKSKYPTRTGNHIEKRKGCVNFSIVGRNAEHVQRKDYYNFDNQTGERAFIAKVINKADKSVTAQVAGETGIDIYERNKDKGQIIKDFDKDDTVYFFGDRMDEAGNDYPLAKKNTLGYNITVADWEDTYNRLLLLKAMGIIQ